MISTFVTIDVSHGPQVKGSFRILLDSFLFSLLILLVVQYEVCSRYFLRFYSFRFRFFAIHFIHLIQLTHIPQLCMK